MSSKIPARPGGPFFGVGWVELRSSDGRSEACQTKAGTRPVTEQASSPLRGKRLGLCCQNEPQKTTLTGSEAEVRDGNCPSCTGPAGSEVKSDNPALGCFSTPPRYLFLPFSRAQTGDFGQKLGFSRTGSVAGKQCH